MSCQRVVSEKRSELLDKKCYTKINPIGKLHIIYSLDNGHSKSDIAKIYGVQTQTITYIYNQKEAILRKHIQKNNLLKEVRLLNLDQTLLNWLKEQILNDVTVTEAKLLEKAQSLTQHLNEDFIDIEDWLLDFQHRHNIIKYVPEVWHREDIVEEWRKFITEYMPNLYVGGTCAISHSLCLDSFATGTQSDDYMSILFIAHISGLCKKRLAIVGKEKLVAETDISSLPANYYTNNGYITQLALQNYLLEWDLELSTEGNTVYLLLNMPNYSSLNLQFKNIKIIVTSKTFFSKSLEEIAECFKYNYRKLLIMKKVNHGNEVCLGLVDYISMISLAWFNVPNFYVKQIFMPPVEGSIYLRPIDACDGNHSLLKWCEKHNIPLQSYDHCLDQYIFCDKDIEHVDLHVKTEEYELRKNIHPSSGMEAYQAMKRLLSYVQGENASENVLTSAKLLEDHLEYGALLEIHNVIATSNVDAE